MGAEFADLVQREIVARTDLQDCRTHAKTWDLLRHTRMPAVRIELGYVTNAADAAKLADPTFRDAVAEAVVVAVQRLYLPADQDADTGFLRLPMAPAAAEPLAVRAAHCAVAGVGTAGPGVGMGRPASRRARRWGSTIARAKASPAPMSKPPSTRASVRSGIRMGHS